MATLSFETRDIGNQKPQPFTLFNEETFLEIETMLQPLNPWHTFV